MVSLGSSFAQGEPRPKIGEKCGIVRKSVLKGLRSVWCVRVEELEFSGLEPIMQTGTVKFFLFPFSLF